MRTTLNIEEDVLERARSVALKKHAPFREVINEALRAGLSAAESPCERHRYVTKPHSMGLKPGLNLDNIQELLAAAEGEDSR